MSRPPTLTVPGLFSASGPLSPSTAPTAPLLYLVVKPEPVNSWGGVSFDKWHRTPGFLPSCRHIVDSSVWSQAMCSDPSGISGHDLHARRQHPLRPTGFTIQVNICEFNRYFFYKPNWKPASALWMKQRQTHRQRYQKSATWAMKLILKTPEKSLITLLFILVLVFLKDWRWYTGPVLLNLFINLCRLKKLNHTKFSSTSSIPVQPNIVLSDQASTICLK